MTVPISVASSGPRPGAGENGKEESASSSRARLRFSGSSASAYMLATDTVTFLVLAIRVCSRAIGVWCTHGFEKNVCLLADVDPRRSVSVSEYACQ
jgi:hypothetical protein